MRGTRIRKEAISARGCRVDARLASRLSPLLIFAAALLAAALSGCGSTAKRDSGATPPTRGGGYYLDDGPGASPPPDLDRVPDAVPRPEPIRAATSRPYEVMGRTYTPMSALSPYRARGIATWYGRRYHGRRTASGEPYDMYAMTAAHPTLPIPSYARVTHLANGRSVVVRINDRGPFIGDRLIDLSYTAAYKLGLLGGGSGLVEVETILPGDAAPQVAAAPPDAGPPPGPGADAPPPAPVAVPLPAAAVNATAAPDAPPVEPDAAGHYLQLGAFGSKDNAENFLLRMRARMGALAETLHLRAGEGLFRVQAGPYASEPEARRAAQRLGETLGVKPFVLTR